MAREVLGLDEFFTEFRGAIVYGSRGDSRRQPTFGLILGAGASRSAGIPLANEMVAALKKIRGRRGQKKRPRQREESDFSYRFRTSLRTKEDRRTFIRNCTSRACSEPNLTHLIAVDFAANGIFGPLVTTNFDELLLSAFWSLRQGWAFREPHVVYDPRSGADELQHVAAGVPKIIKAHGHHTSYALGVLDREIGGFAPYVKKALESTERPHFGFLVVGYSGRWLDGVMAALQDPEYTRGQPIYWFYRERPPRATTAARKRLFRNGNLKFVQTSDCDELFLRMWWEVSAAAESEIDIAVESWMVNGDSPTWMWNPPALLDTGDLYTPPSYLERSLLQESRRKPLPARLPRKFSGELEDYRQHRSLVALRKRFLPILDAIDRIDEEYLDHELLHGLPGASLPMVDFGVVSGREQALVDKLPTGTAWTRRNRKIFRLALGPLNDPMLPFTLLEPVEEFSRHQAAP